MAASYGVPAAAVERAFERGVNYLYWGSMRRGGFGQALRNLKAQRDQMVLVLQSYTRIAALTNPSVEIALRKLRFDYVDVLLLGLWNHKPPVRILDACRKLRERGVIRHIAVSTHHRPLVAELSADPDIGIVHVRYNAVHKGAEREVFPTLGTDGKRLGCRGVHGYELEATLGPEAHATGRARAHSDGLLSLRSIESLSGRLHEWSGRRGASGCGASSAGTRRHERRGTGLDAPSRRFHSQALTYCL